MRFKSFIIAIAIIVTFTVSCWIGSQTAGFQRNMKTIKSNFGGGLERTITVYDNYGNVLKQYDTKADIEDRESKVLFDTADGKRIIVYNAIVIAEEK